MRNQRARKKDKHYVMYGRFFQKYYGTGILNWSRYRDLIPTGKKPKKYL